METRPTILLKRLPVVAGGERLIGVGHLVRLLT